MTTPRRLWVVEHDEACPVNRYSLRETRELARILLRFCIAGGICRVVAYVPARKRGEREKKK